MSFKIVLQTASTAAKESNLFTHFRQTCTFSNSWCSTQLSSGWCPPASKTHIFFSLFGFPLPELRVTNNVTMLHQYYLSCVNSSILLSIQQFHSFFLTFVPVRLAWLLGTSRHFSAPSLLNCPKKAKKILSFPVSYKLVRTYSNTSFLVYINDPKKLNSWTSLMSLMASHEYTLACVLSPGKFHT